MNPIFIMFFLNYHKLLQYTIVQILKYYKIYDIYKSINADTFILKKTYKDPLDTYCVAQTVNHATQDELKGH